MIYCQHWICGQCSFPILDYSVFLLEYFHSNIHTIHSYPIFLQTTSPPQILIISLSSNFWTVFHFVLHPQFYIPPMNNTLFSKMILGNKDLIVSCLQNHSNVFLANRVKCWNQFTYSTKFSDSCFTIIYIRFVIQWPWVYNTFLFEWVHPENNVHQKEWSADGCIVIDKEWYYVNSYKLSQIAQQSQYYY